MGFEIKVAETRSKVVMLARNCAHQTVFGAAFVGT